MNFMIKVNIKDKKLKKREKTELTQEREFPKGSYQIILADPPWTYDDKCSAGQRGAGFKYSLMTNDELMALPVSSIADTNCILFMWATFPKINDALRLISSWGFIYKTVAFTWVKKTMGGKNFIGMGRWTRSNAEVVLLATKGQPTRINSSIGQIIEARVKEHSRKPDVIRTRITQLIGNLPRIELFARTRVHGWDTWGNDHKLELPPLEEFDFDEK